MISKEDIKKLANLARLELTENETESFASEVDSILGYVGQISNVAGEINIETPDLRNVMRNDEPQNTANNYTESILKNAPQREGNYLKVKKIL